GGRFSAVARRFGQPEPGRRVFGLHHAGGGCRPRRLPRRAAIEREEGRRADALSARYGFGASCSGQGPRATKIRRGSVAMTVIGSAAAVSFRNVSGDITA